MLNIKQWHSSLPIIKTLLLSEFNRPETHPYDLFLLEVIRSRYLNAPSPEPYKIPLLGSYLPDGQHKMVDALYNQMVRHYKSLDFSIVF